MKSDSDALIEALAILRGLLIGGPGHGVLTIAESDEIRQFLAREAFRPMGSGGGRYPTKLLLQNRPACDHPLTTSTFSGEQVEEKCAVCGDFVRVSAKTWLLAVADRLKADDNPEGP